MDIEVQIKDETSLQTALRRAILGPSAKKGKKTYVLLALADALSETINKKIAIDDGKVVGIHLDVERDGLSNIKVATYTKEEEFSLKTLRIKNIPLNEFVTVEEAS